MSRGTSSRHGLSQPFEDTKITRRSFIAAGLAATALEAGRPLGNSCAEASGMLQSGAGKPQPGGAAVDQNTIRRRGTGLRALDISRASPGLTLFAPIDGDGTVYLIDLRGEVVHTWRMPYTPGLYGYLTEEGILLYNGKIPGDTFQGKTPYRGGVVLAADWNGKILWEVREEGHHHDGRLLKNGNVILLSFRELPDDFAKKILGGRPGSEANGKIYADFLVEMTREGRRVWEWYSWEHLDPAEEVITMPMDVRVEWTHGNAVIELPNGDLMVSFRNTSSVIQIDRKTGSVVWRLGAPPLSGQHAPTPLGNGNILIFDNGPHRVDESLPYSRVIEINPSSKEIVWSFQETIPPNFYSPRISNAQRLPNGNTLINEGLFGRFFEVTSKGEVVWEYVNPYFGPSDKPANIQGNRVFRVYRYTEEEISRARNRI